MGDPVQRLPGDEPSKLRICPSCGWTLGPASYVSRVDNLDLERVGTDQADEIAPSPGDCTVCLGCGEIAEFDIELNLVSPQSPVPWEAQQLSHRARGIIRKSLRRAGTQCF